MDRRPPGYSIDALIAALELARDSWHDANARASVRRVAAHAAAAALLPSLSSCETLASLDELIAQLRAARAAEAAGNAILIVEDDRLAARVMEDVLGNAERAVLVARSAAEAAVLIREHDLGLILLDLVLPDGDGRDLLTTIRNTPATRAVPVIVVTARTDAVSQAECFALGADVLLPKPVAPHVLLAAVSAQLSHAAERRLEGRVDGLTMLPNRTAFMDALTRAAPLAQRNRQPLAAGMVDLDHFKSVNDTYGHSAGDQVLQRCA
ncbi:MAG: response regulator, partial [Gemmatimonadota bacterium]